MTPTAIRLLARLKAESRRLLPSKTVKAGLIIQARCAGASIPQLALAAEMTSTQIERLLK